jgi:hypothetical protein
MAAILVFKTILIGMFMQERFPPLVDEKNSSLKGGKRTRNTHDIQKCSMMLKRAQSFVWKANKEMSKICMV